MYAPPPGPPIAPPRESRLTALLRHSERSAVLLALLIGFASVFSAVVAWRASLASIDAFRYQSLTVQQQARLNEIERELAGLVDQDLRFVNVYQEHALAARELRAQADALRDSEPDTADLLDLEAQGEAALARAVLPFFVGASGIRLADDGTVPYDRDFVLRNLRDANVEWRELQAQNTSELARRADAHALALIGVAALVVAALFFLTVAQVSRRQLQVRQGFFVAGTIVAVTGVLGFVLVELLA